jgi:hypothetical protein
MKATESQDGGAIQVKGAGLSAGDIQSLQGAVDGQVVTDAAPEGGALRGSVGATEARKSHDTNQLAELKPDYFDKVADAKHAETTSGSGTAQLPSHNRN